MVEIKTLVVLYFTMLQLRTRSIKELAGDTFKLLDCEHPIHEENGHQMGYLSGTLLGMADGFIDHGQAGISRVFANLELADDERLAEAHADLEALGMTSSKVPLRASTEALALGEKRRHGAAQLRSFLSDPAFVDRSGSGRAYVDGACQILDGISNGATEMGILL